MIGEGTVYRCSSCDINYPPRSDKQTCPACGKDTWQTSAKGGYDDDWREKLRDAQNRQEMNGDPVPDVEVPLHWVKGRYWVAHADLLRKGYTFLEDFRIVRIRGTYYELQGHVGDEQNLVEGGAWWVEAVNPATAFDHLPTLTEEQYAALNERRGLSAA